MVIFKIPSIRKYLILMGCLVPLFCLAQPFTVVLDPGHGGRDAGCSGLHHLHEKQIVLDIAKKTHAILSQEAPQIDVHLTRNDDKFISLYQRTEIANKLEANLFVSIHCNHFHQKRTHGTEVYVMGLHKSEENLQVAKRENEAILFEEHYQTQYEGYDPNSPAGHIILSMTQNNYLKESIQLGVTMLESFDTHTTLKPRDVKQAGFVVLKRATMPAVLLETGFISNYQDSKYLATEKGRLNVARSIAHAIIDHLDQIEQDVTTNTIKQTTIEDPFFIQLEKTENGPLQQFDSRWKQINSFSIKQEGSQYRYLSAPYASLIQANDALLKLRKSGFSNARIVKY